MKQYLIENGPLFAVLGVMSFIFLVAPVFQVNGREDAAIWIVYIGFGILFIAGVVEIALRYRR